MYFHKSTLMEALGPLATLLLHPNRTPGQQCLHPARGRSIYDELTTAIVGASRIKACRVVAAHLHCNISAEWIPRRSNR